MKKLVSKLALLGMMIFGIFFMASDSAVNASIPAPSCQECIELQIDCNARCEAGERGCAWCTNKVNQCFSICQW